MVTCCKVTGTNTPTQKTHLVLCVGNEEMVAGSKVYAAKKDRVSCLCLLYSV